MKPSKIESLHPTPSKVEKFLLNLLANKKKLIKNLVITLGGFFIVFAFFGTLYHFKNKKVSESHLSSTDASHAADLGKLKKLAERYPTLQTRLDASLAQQYLNQNQIQKSKSLIQRVEKRQLEGLPFIKDLNEMSFLLESHQYKKALALGESLLAELEKYPNLKSLYTFQLVRLIALERRCNLVKKHPEHLEKLRHFSTVSGQEVKEDFQFGNLNLVSYTLDPNISL